ncbi:hypothetical protein [Gramella sp. AN32]|uniref:DUF2268 domain-containing protein n=1 Tax=Christiangramia antarctica TaxID=2058158 RepID=A0ABW5X4T6_9FLAO|nr:hypothetical protein [Gramella sp. AN32]
MKKIIIILFIILFQKSIIAQNNENIVTSDIDNFWTTYDRINSTNDSITKNKILQTEYIDKASSGLKAMIQARRYTPEQYIYAINNYPLFWNSIREKTKNIHSYSNEIEKGIKSLKLIYPDLKPAKVYFTIGVFRSNGTTVDNKVLIGSEMALTDSTVIVSEFPESLNYFKDYIATNPIQNLPFLNVHEYIHTQQNTTIGNSLLAQTVIEGVAEYVATLALNIDSPNPQISFGEKNEESIKEAFSKEMFSPHFNNWLWNDSNNKFKMRDLAYYVGYSIAKNFYLKSNEKNEAVKEMIELDYADQEELMRFVNQSEYFQKGLEKYEKDFNSNRPIIKEILPFDNGCQQVDPKTEKITINFSSIMDDRFRGFDYGPLGEENVLRVQEFLGFSEDKKSVSIKVELEPNKRYQLTLSNRFRDTDGIPIEPFLIDITTKSD